MKIKVEFEVDAREFAKKIGRRCSTIELEEKVCNLVDEEIMDNIKFDGLEDWDAYKEVIRQVEEYLHDWYPDSDNFETYNEEEAKKKSYEIL